MGQHTHNDDQVDQAVIQASILPDVGEVGEDLRGHSEVFSFHLTSLTAPDVSCPCFKRCRHAPVYKIINRNPYEPALLRDSTGIRITGTSGVA